METIHIPVQVPFASCEGCPEFELSRGVIRSDLSGNSVMSYSCENADLCESVVGHISRCCIPFGPVYGSEREYDKYNKGDHK